MSEGSGPGTTSTKFDRDSYKLGTVGKPYLGVELKLDSVDPTTGDGEVCSGATYHATPIFYSHIINLLLSIMNCYYIYYNG